MRRMWVCGLAVAAAGAVLGADGVFAQGIPGSSGMPGRPSNQPIVPSGDEPSAPAAEKPDAAAKKFFKAAVKSLNKAKEYEAAAAGAANDDKRAKNIEKMGDAYNAALDQFTEALANNGDLIDAWDDVGYVHLKLGAYREAVDDYNHTLTLKPELLEAVEHRAEAYLALDRVEDVQASYMDLYNHDPALAAQLMTLMQKWVSDHRIDPHGMRTSTIDAFDKWLAERDGIAKQTASLPHP